LKKVHYSPDQSGEREQFEVSAIGKVKKQNPVRYIEEPYGAPRTGNYLYRLRVTLPSKSFNSLISKDFLASKYLMISALRAILTMSPTYSYRRFSRNVSSFFQVFSARISEHSWANSYSSWRFA
jgi:hypothetical protein